VRTRGLRITWAAPFTVVLLTPTLAAGLEQLSGGVSVGGILAGTVPHLAVSPHVGVAWRIHSSVLFTVHDLCSILPPINKAGAGVYNQTSVDIGYTWETGHLSVGPSLSVYSMTTCGVTLCGPVIGVAPGVHAQTNVYVAGPLGVSVSANVDWVGGRSLVLPGGVAAMVVAGPVIRWNAKGTP
jgi:hypothetical protein